MSKALKIDRTGYKIGVNEIEGLKEVLVELLKPVQEKLKDSVYWSDVEIEDTEYKSRDGFIAFSHNCGGAEISVVIPKCEEYSFSFLSFGECDDEECDHEVECMFECEGHLDAKLRVWLKFEGLNDAGEMEFYLYLGGGNGDAPYFRTKYEATVFEASFTAKSLAGVKRNGTAVVKKLLKAIA